MEEFIENFSKFRDFLYDNEDLTVRDILDKFEALGLNEVF